MTGGQPLYEWGSRDALRPGTAMALDILAAAGTKTVRHMAAALIEHDLVALTGRVGQLADENERLREQNALLRSLAGADGPIVIDGWRVA
jgi:hypothetical protein